MAVMSQAAAKMPASQAAAATMTLQQQHPAAAAATTRKTGSSRRVGGRSSGGARQRRRLVVQRRLGSSSGRAGSGSSGVGVVGLLSWSMRRRGSCPWHSSSDTKLCCGRCCWRSSRRCCCGYVDLFVSGHGYSQLEYDGLVCFGATGLLWSLRIGNAAGAICRFWFDSTVRLVLSATVSARLGLGFGAEGAAPLNEAWLFVICVTGHQCDVQLALVVERWYLPGTAVIVCTVWVPWPVGEQCPMLQAYTVWHGLDLCLASLSNCCKEQYRCIGLLAFGTKGCCQIAVLY